MCGIVGFISSQKKPKLIEKLTLELSHRGPDEQNYKIIEIDNNYLHLGSARLSIRDLNEGQMPMINNKGDHIVYNGEIFNFSELRDTFNLSSLKSDTKLMLEILSNSRSIPKFNGMYAYAFYKKNEKKVYISRDRFGIKPLYYAKTNKFPFVFSSELSTFQSIEFETNIISKKEIESFIYFGGFTNSSHPITRVKKVQPGSYIEFDISSMRLVNSICNNDLTKVPDKNKSFKDVFKDVVNDHLDADTNVDILLSGGIDSSLLALVTKYELDKNVRTFSLGFDNDVFDESSKSLFIAKKLNFEHEHIIFKQNEINEIIDEFLSSTSEPIGDPSIIPSFYLYKNVSKHTKAVLSGDGADEMFLGYEWHKAAIIQKNKVLNGILNMRFLGNLFNLSLRNSDKYYKYYKFFQTIDKDLFTQILFWQNINIDEHKQESLYQKLIYEIDFDDNSFYNNLKKLDLTFYLATNILPKADIGSMLNGLEVRPPYLDERILQYSFNNKVKRSLFKHFTYSKHELRDLLKIYTNNKFSKQSKQGFSPNFENWDKGSAIELISKYSKDFQIVNKFLELHKLGDMSYFNTRELWKFYAIFHWIENKKLIID